MAKAAVLLPRQEMQQMAADLIAQYPNLSPFCIEYTYTDAACQRAIRLQNDGCELILARGLQAALVDELAHQIPNIVGMKDTSGDITLTEEFIRRTRDVGHQRQKVLPPGQNGRGKRHGGDITLTKEFIRRTRDVGVPYRPSLPTPAGAARDGFVRTMTAAGLL